MFKKKPTIKPFAPLKSSERRKIADQIITDLDIDVPPDVDASTGTGDGKAPAVTNRTTIRNSLLPENSLSARFTTTTGSTLQQVSGTVYVGSNEGQDQRILWAKIEDRMFPTVYSLWTNTAIIPLLHTPPVAVESIQRGSDLMTPGLAFGPPFPEKAKKGALVAIASTEAPTVPIAVGVCETDVSALETVQGAKGHAVRILHWLGDELWNWSAVGQPGKPAPATLDGWLGTGATASNVTEDVAHLSIVDNDMDGGVRISDQQEPGTAAVNQGLSINDHPLAEVVDEPELNTKEIDDAFLKAFLYGVHHHMDINKGQANFGLQFPLSQSFIMANLVQPFLPATTPSRIASLQIKKTSWRNIKKFIKYMDKQRIIKSKDRDGNEVVILDIDFNHQNIQDFVPYSLPRKDAVGSSNASKLQKGGPSSDPSDPSIGQKLRKLELFRPRERQSAICIAVGSNPRGLYSATELRDMINAYAEKEELVSPTNKRFIKINPIIADAALIGNQQTDRELLAKGTIARDKLTERIVQSCSPFHLMLRDEEEADYAKAKSGAVPNIHVVLETRSGNKTVTKVSGMEAYNITPLLLADELKKACAGATSVEQLKGSSPKIPVMEVMVQGPQKDAILKALERRGINKQWIDVTDKTKGKKK